MDEEEKRFQEWMMSKGPDGRPVWAAPEGPAESRWRDGPVAQFLKSFFQSLGGLTRR